MEGGLAAPLACMIDSRPVSMSQEQPKMSEYPKLAAGLEINQVSDGYVVYQPSRDRVHYLNQTATVLLELCNGSNSTAAIAELLAAAYELPAPPVGEVETCLAQLRGEGLVS